MTEGRRRRVAGWGFEGEELAPSDEMLAWLEERIGPTEPMPARPIAEPPAARDLPRLPAATSRDAGDRWLHARGRGYSDLVRLRAGACPRVPDAVVRPQDAEQVGRVLTVCAATGVRVIPFGGGTSVTGGVNPIPGPDPVVTLDLCHLSGLHAIDEGSQLATFGAGTLGPDLERALEPYGFTLGHFPQSFELSTVGGWVVTRSSGQESLGYGRIEDMTAGLELVAPAGRMSIPSLPASAAGPDLRQLVLGSEGRLGVVTEVTVRVRRRPRERRVLALLVPDWTHGITAATELTRSGLPLTMLRLSDPDETEVAMAAGLGTTPFEPLVRGWLRVRGVGPGSCLLLLGSAGDPLAVDDTIDEARAIARDHRAVSLGFGPGRHWLRDRFRHPYLRDGLLERGIGTDTLETAAPWSRLPAVYAAVREALADALAGEEERVAVLCHLSHPYVDGASLYFTFFFRQPTDPDAAIARWAVLKRRATEAIVDSGAALSHHHGVGSWHAPWYRREAGTDGARLIEVCASTMDPASTLNPHVLLDPADRLEV